MAPYVNVEYNADTFIEELDRLVEQDPAKISLVLGKVLEEYDPDFDDEDRLRGSSPISGWISLKRRRSVSRPHGGEGAGLAERGARNLRGAGVDLFPNLRPDEDLSHGPVDPGLHPLRGSGWGAPAGNGDEHC